MIAKCAETIKALEYRGILRIGKVSFQLIEMIYLDSILASKMDDETFNQLTYI
jgi:hypothetical protein